MVRALHLVGSVVSDFHAGLSRLYAQDALGQLSGTDSYDHVVAHLSPDGRWRFPTGLDERALADAAPLTTAQALATIDALAVDVMVPQMFCIPGMTSYRSLFDVLGVPFLGNPAAVMALTAHKARARAVVAAAGVDVPEAELLGRGANPTLRAPVVVKPVDADNSDGVALVREASQYPDALRAARAHSDHVLVERYVELGREVRCGLLERDGRLVGLPLEEYAVSAGTKPVRTRADKLAATADGGLRLVAKDAAHAWLVDPGDPLTDRVHAAARAAHVALGCRDYSLFDFRVDPDGRPWFLEASLYCSFAGTSVLSVMAAGAGMGVPELFHHVAQAALARTPAAADRPTVMTSQPGPDRTGPDLAGADMQITPTRPVGARVTGISLRELDAATVEQLLRALAEHGVLVLPDQHVDDDVFLAFLQQLGRLTFATGETPVPGHPDLNVVSNVGRTTPPRSQFHTDTSYLRRPPVYTALRAVQIPSQGGETVFTNQYRAVETLSHEVRAQLEGRTIHHVVTGLELGPDEETEADHPVLLTHPVSGRTTLYMSTPARCAGVSGLPQDEADALVRHLYEHSTRDDNTVRHTWAPGDVVVWDNRVVLHRGDHSDVVGDRVMHRGMVVERA